MNKLDETNTQCRQISCFIFLFTDEERATCTKSCLEKNKTMPQNIIILYFNDDDTKKIDELFCMNENLRIEKIKISHQLSENFSPYLTKIAEKVTDIKEVGLDITCIPIPFFVQIINYLYNNDKSIIAYYSQPNHYRLNEMYEYLSLNGELKINHISGFPGKIVKRSESERLLIYQIGFEGKNIFRRIIEDIEPKEIIPLNGFPAFFPKYKDISLVNNDKNYYADGNDISFAEANNPFDTFNQLLKICNEPKSSNYCIDIMISSTKPMALGACLFALKNTKNSVRLLFPFPAEYEPKQSTGVGAIWEYKL
ncbi:MAG: hypothetical protein LBC85_00845 [Fibromonadaceae bacterium]|jgi:hypothetical protein|nr:hypothetical protein [Fibromonadaceae bacterium]